MITKGGCGRVTLAVAVALLAPTVAHGQITCDPCTIGVVLDGPWERNDELRGIFEEEILNLAATDFDVRFPADKRRVGDWSLQGAAAAVDALMTDPDVDLLLTMGPVASTYAGRLTRFPKPVVAAFVIDPVVQEIPTATNALDERVSGVPNLNYITFPSDIDQYVRRLREITPFRKLVFLTSVGLAEAIPELEANLLVRTADLDIDPVAVRVGTSVDEAMAAIPEDAEAVYVYPLIQLPSGDFQRLVQALIDRRLPSFSYWGRQEVELGLLASLYPGEEFGRLGRRIALNVQRILLGEDAGGLPVDFERRVRVSLNVATARAIGVHPPWSVWTEVEVVGDRERGFRRQLTLPMAAEEAVAANLDLLAINRFVAAGAEEERLARSALRPQVSVSGFGQFIDQDRAASFSGGPERLAAASATVSQLLYSDGALANVDIQRDVQVSREQQREQIRLDVIFDTTVAYLNVLRAKTFEDIQRENLRVTRSNLDLAQIRQEIGVARAAEVIRWENEIANDRREVINAIARRNVAEIRVNALLDRPLEEPFLTEEVDLDDPGLLTTALHLGPYTDNPFAFDVFRDFMTAEAVVLAPELRQIDASIRAQERALTAAGRAFWAPTVGFTADVSAAATGGAGSGGLDLDFVLPVPIARPNAVTWTLSLSASLPLFTGGARRAERAQITEELEQLRLSRRSVAQQVGQGVRSALHSAGASYAGIELAEASASAAQRTLEAVTDAYEQGATSILDVLDAQNQALVADQVAANAVYDYLIDLMGVQRAVGCFDFFLEPDEYQAFMDRLESFFAQAGFEPGLATGGRHE